MLVLPRFSDYLNRVKLALTAANPALLAEFGINYMDLFFAAGYEHNKEPDRNPYAKRGQKPEHDCSQYRLVKKEPDQTV